MTSPRVRGRVEHPSCSVAPSPGGAASGLFRRVPYLVAADNLGAMLVGTAALSPAANSFELLSGLMMLGLGALC